MNRLLAILLLICLALPGAGWARPGVAVEAVCAPEAAMVTAGAETVEEEHCGCCERMKRCGCEVRKTEEAPGRTVPAAPPRPVSAGEPVFVAPPTAPYDFAMGDAVPYTRDAVRPLSGCGRAMGRTVPTRILHCSRLC